MSCFPCFGSKKTGSKKYHDDVPIAKVKDIASPVPTDFSKRNTPTNCANNTAEAQAAEEGSNTSRAFTFRELASATKNFRKECILGESGIGRVYKGTLQPSGQIVAVRQLDRSGTQGSREFQVEVLMLSLLRHPNLVNIMGYCADGDQRLLVYEYIPSGSLRNHLFDISQDRKPIDWPTRMKIASGIAQGLEYLHEKANPPIIYRDLKSSNILLDETNNPKLSEYGLSKLMMQSGGNKMHVSPRVMSAYGYCAPEYERHGELTPKSDVYSFGVVLLELITGRRAFDGARPTDEQNLVSWAQPIFRDPKRFPALADPLLRNEFPVMSLNQAVGVASMCLHEEPSVRPLITDVVAALSFLAMAPPEAPIPAHLTPMISSASQDVNVAGHKQEGNSSLEYEGLNHHTNEHHRYDEVEENENPNFTSDDSSESSDDEDRNRTKY